MIKKFLIKYNLKKKLKKVQSKEKMIAVTNENLLLLNAKNLMQQLEEDLLGHLYLKIKIIKNKIKINCLQLFRS